MVLVPENALERLQQRQKILTPPVTQTLKNFDSQMGDILESKQLGDEGKAKLYNQVLQRYLTYYDKRKGQPLHVKLTTPETTETPKPVENAQSTEEASPDNSLPTALEQEVMKSVPKIYKAGGEGLDSCWIKLKNTRMCCTEMIKESCCMKTNQSQVLMWST